MIQVFDDAYFMKKALLEAETAFSKGEIPVGAVIVANNQIIARAHNLTEQLTDVTAHAEMQAITAAAKCALVHCIGVRFLKLYLVLQMLSVVAVQWEPNYIQKLK